MWADFRRFNALANGWDTLSINFAVSICASNFQISFWDEEKHMMFAILVLLPSWLSQFARQNFAGILQGLDFWMRQTAPIFLRQSFAWTTVPFGNWLWPFSSDRIIRDRAVSNVHKCNVGEHQTSEQEPNLSLRMIGQLSYKHDDGNCKRKRTFLAVLSSVSA